MPLKTINPPLKRQQVRQRQAPLSFTQEVTDKTTNPVYIKNVTSCTDHFVLLNHLQRLMTHDICTYQLFFSPESGSKNIDGREG